MRHTHMFVLVAALMLLALALSITLGCGRAKQVKEAAEVARTVQDAQDGDFTVKTDESEMKIETDKAGEEGGKMTVTGPDGSATFESGADTVSAEDVGIDFYPGAKVEAGSTWSASGEKGGAMSSVSLETRDAFDKVAKFYKDKYGKGNTVVEQPTSLMIMMNEGDNAGKMIMVSREEDSDVTTIAITATEGG